MSITFPWKGLGSSKVKFIGGPFSCLLSTQPGYMSTCHTYTELMAVLWMRELVRTRQGRGQVGGSSGELLYRGCVRTACANVVLQCCVVLSIDWKAANT